MAKIPELEGLKARVAKLEATIHDEDARRHLLTLAKNWLGDVERDSVPGVGVNFVLALTEQQVAYAEKVVAKYGPEIRIVGGTGKK